MRKLIFVLVSLHLIMSTFSMKLNNLKSSCPCNSLKEKRCGCEVGVGNSNTDVGLNLVEIEKRVVLIRPNTDEEKNKP